MAKKTRKKSARVAAGTTATKKARGRKPGRAASLRGVSTTELQAELQRRASDLTGLQAKRDSLMAQVDEIDSEISVINAALGNAARGTGARVGIGARRGRKPGAAKAGRPRAKASGRKRPHNDASLEVSLAKVLQGKTMGVTEVANAVQKAGYKTTSPNFRTIVNQTLIRSELIKKLARGAYTAK